MKTLLLCLAALALAGCNTAPPRVEIQRVNIEVPVACRERVPDRPVMPTEELPKVVDVDPWVQAAQAEIERREGYEVELRAALVACTKPIKPAPP